MKTLTCKEMGGWCDTAVTAATKDEMMTKGMEHIRVAHPEEAAKIEAMPKDDPAMVEWYTKFEKTWAAAPTK